MEKQQKKQVKKGISWVLILVLVGALAYMPVLAGEQEAAEGPQASILSTVAEYGDISTWIQGGGSLSAQTEVEITIPSAVKLTQWLVENGDVVAEGQALASVDRVSVMSAIAQIQETLDYLAEEIQSASSDEEQDSVTAQVGGTVKILYAQAGDDVQAVMLEHGALAVLSLDGLMAVQVERYTDYAIGDTVYVTIDEDTEVPGKVEANYGGILTVTLEDDGYAVGQTVKVTSEDGDRIGSGSLYIHSQWNAVAYSGTVSKVWVAEEAAVSQGKRLFSLEDTGHTAAYTQMVSQRQAYELLMLELFQMYQTQQLTAPCAGVVTGVDADGAYMLSQSGSGWTVSLLSNAPNGDDETSYINYIGQVASVGIDGLIVKLNPLALQIMDYRDLSTIPMDTALMTEDVIYTGNAPVYELTGGEWVQIEAGAVSAGDILLFAGDEAGNFVWLVRVASGTAAPSPETPDNAGEATEPTDSTAPTESTEPGESIEPSAPVQTPDSTENPEETTDSSVTEGTTDQTMPGQTGGNSFQSSFGITGGMTQEEEYALYSLDTVTVASVTPQETMTIAFTVDELDLSSIALGQSADIRLDALKGETFTGTVTSIGNTGENEGGNSKFTVEVTLNRESRMLAGMSASVSIPLCVAENVLTVPAAALVEDGAKTILYTGYDEETGELGAAVPVTTGLSDGENVQILSGLEAGATVYYGYYDTLVIADAPSQTGFSFGRFG